MNIEVVLADYLNETHAHDLVELLDIYAKDPMGGNEGLPSTVKANLAVELSKRPHAFSLICYVNGKPAGLTNCFEAFSTFSCQPIINIHDIMVDPEFRGLGISQRMLERVEAIARDKGCCKVTLEVLEGNEPAKQAYMKYGFAGYELDPEMGKAMFWQKKLA